MNVFTGPGSKHRIGRKLKSESSRGVYISEGLGSFSRANRCMNNPRLLRYLNSKFYSYHGSLAMTGHQIRGLGAKMHLQDQGC